MRIVENHAEIQAALGDALRVVRVLRDDRAADYAISLLEALGAAASAIAQDVVRLQDLYDPRPREDWRAILREKSEAPPPWKRREDAA